MNILSNTAINLKPSPIISLNTRTTELKQQNKETISLGMGEPDFDTFDYIKLGAIQAITEGHTKYTVADGEAELKQAISEKFKRENSLTYDHEQISVATGLKQVLYNLWLVTINPGDEVIIPAPYWHSYIAVIEMLGGVPIVLPSNSDFTLSPERLDSVITTKTKWLILNSPSNPSGLCYTKAQLHALAQVLLQHPQIHIAADDIYEHITYDNHKFHTIAQVEPELYERTFTLNGVSKAYAMTGWRIGYMGSANREVIKAMRKIQGHTTTCSSSISQRAAATALRFSDEKLLHERRNIFQKRRDLLVNTFNSIPGMHCHKPQGAFYAFPSITGLIGKVTPDGMKINNCTDFANYLLEKYLLGVVPGIAFGMLNHVRFSYAASNKLLHTACERLQDACAKLK